MVVKSKDGFSFSTKSHAAFSASALEAPVTTVKGKKR